MSKPQGALREYQLIIAMTLCSHLLPLMGAATAAGLAWYFDAWPFLLIGVGGVIVFTAESILDNRAPGFTVRPQDEPELLALIQEVAARLGVDHLLIVRVIPIPDASMAYERVEGRAAFVLDLGWPMLTLMSRQELSAVIAHELAHVDELSTRRGRHLNASRNRLAASWHVPFLTEALLGLSRNETVATELAADQVAAGTVGRENVASALIRTAQIDALFDMLVEDWCEVMTEVGEYPEDVHECARLALEDPEVQAWLMLNIDREPEIPDPSDTHPSLHQRLAGLDLAEATRQAGEPVRIRQHAEIERWCLDEVFGPDDSDLRPGSIRTSPLGRFDHDPNQALADLRAATDERSTPVALHRVAERITDGTWRQLALDLEPDLADAPAEIRGEAEVAVFVNCVGTALISPLVTAGWTRANPWINQVVESPEGERINVYDEIERAIADADGNRVRCLSDAVVTGMSVLR